MSKMSFKSDGLQGFKQRAYAHARALDRGKSLPSESTTSFASPQDMMHFLSPRRVRLLQSLATTGSQPLNKLAETLGRNPAIVQQDITVLAEIGAVHITRRTKNGVPVTWVKPAADHFEFTFSFGASKPEASQTEYAAAS